MQSRDVCETLAILHKKKQRVKSGNDCHLRITNLKEKTRKQKVWFRFSYANILLIMMRKRENYFEIKNQHFFGKQCQIK